MAIIIPSSKIFNIDRPLVLKNKVDKVGVDTNVVKPNNEYDTFVFNNGYRNFPNESGEIYNKLQRTVDSGFDTVKEIWVYHSIQGVYSRISIQINKLTGTKYISKINKGYDDENNPLIMCNIQYSIYEGNATATAYYNPTTMKNELTNLSYGFNTLPSTSSQTNKIEPPLKSEFTTTNAGSSIDFITVVAEIKDFSNHTNLSGEMNYYENKDYYRFDIYLLSGYEKIYLAGERESDSENWRPEPVNIKGDCEKFVAKQIEITIYGNTIGIDLTNETFEFGEGENPLNISGNELLQDGTTTKGDTTSKFIATNIIKQYSNGKEKATLRCAIGNYFDENGEKKISIDNDNLPMEFSVGDEVIPMVYIGNNEEKFMSSKDGKPKKYEVASVKPYFDGACWQEIEIIEKNFIKNP